METQVKNPENNNEIKESKVKDSSNPESIEKIQPTFKGNINYDKRKNFQSNYYKPNHFSHNNQYYYTNNFANLSTGSKIKKGSVKSHNDRGYNNQNYNKNFGEKKNMHSGYKKNRNIDMNHNNDHNNKAFMNDNQLNFINPYKEAEDFSHYNKEFKSISNLNFLKQNWRPKRIPEEENNNDIINGLGLNMFPNKNMNNINYSSLLNLNFNQPLNSFNLGNNQINNNLFLMMNLLNNNKQTMIQNNVTSPNKMPKVNNKMINSMMNFPPVNNNVNNNLTNPQLNLNNIVMMINHLNNNKFKNIPPPQPNHTENKTNKSPQKLNLNNQNNLFNNLPNQINNSFNALIQCYFNTLQYQQIILNKMTQLFNPNSNNNLSIHSEIQNTVNQIKAMLNNEMNQLSQILPQNQNNSNSKSNNTNLDNMNKNKTNNENKENDSLNSNENENSDKYIQNILSTWPKQKFVKPYSPLLKLEKTQSLNKTINTLNINTMSYSNLPDINLSQNFYMSKEQENTYDDKKIEELLKIGKCLKGVIRINKNQNNHGYITVPGINNDILVKGKNLYQSLNLDEVVVELFDFSQWRPLATRKTRKLSHINEEGLLNNLTTNNIYEGDKTKSLEEEEMNLKTKEERINYINKKLLDLRPEGKIVKILKSPNKEEKQICKIKVEKNKIFAYPIDETIPSILINIRNISKKIIPDINSMNYKMNLSYYPNEFEKDYIDYKKKYFYVKIYSYISVNGLPNGYRGHLGYIVNEVGKAGEIDVETTVLLETFKIKYNEGFSEDIMNEVKKKLEEIKITDEYIKNTNRKDFRNELVFTIDPYTSKDLDDAIHVKVIDEEKKLLEIGVHIADPTTYVEENSLLDKEALERATSVYLVQKKIPMLPLILSDDVCSIMPKKDTLTISCIFRIYLKEGTIDETFTPYFCLSVVNSKAKWDYDLVQKIIQKEEVKYDDLKFEDGSKPDTEEIFNNLKKSVDILYKLTKLVRKARFESRSLMIDNDDIYFDLDKNNKPKNFHISIKNESHNLIEELMLISNILCAKFIHTHLEGYSLIRRHPFFNDNKFNEIQRYFSINKMNSIDFNDPPQINKLLGKIKIENYNKYLCIQHKLKFFILRAEYVFAGKYPEEELKHSSLNFPLYTHFSSPIRRYPDMIVHRQLKEILKFMNKEVEKSDFKKFEKYFPEIDHINDRYNSARLISQRSKRLFQILYLKDAPKKLYTALIMDIIPKNTNNKKGNNNAYTGNNNNIGNTNSNNTTNEEDEYSLVMFVPELNFEIEWKMSDNEEIILCKYDRGKNELYVNYMIDKECKNRYLRSFDALQVELNYVDSAVDIKCKINFKQ